MTDRPTTAHGEPASPSTGFEELLTSMATRGQLVHVERLPARPARHARLARPLPPALMPGQPLWAHQAEAIDLLRAGRSVAVVTGTASGKSLCYQLAVAEAAMADPAGTSLLVFPTKALAHDQLRALHTLGAPGLVASTYDGDTAPDDRAWARRHASVVLTNAEMLHTGILPNHDRWATFLKRLRYVIFDELHTLRGIYGSHVAHIIRRLRRLAFHYGGEPAFAFTSATIGDPGHLATALCGLDVTAVVDDGSPRGERLFALWNPPLVNERAGLRASANTETALILAGLVGAGRRAIAFTRSRKSAELVAARAQAELPARLASAVRPYRGGYLAHERRDIEADLASGRLRGVAATTALELGVDVGYLDACVLDGFPGTISSMWQQAGRAGRAQQRSLAVLVAGPDALDQWLMANPREVFGRQPEPVVVNAGNPYILSSQLACAAYEQPLTPEDGDWWQGCGEGTFDEGVRLLVLADQLRLRDGRAVYAARGRPAFRVGLRSGSRAEVRIVDLEGNMVGTVDEPRATETVHPGAVYLHHGQHYRVEELDLAERVAWVSATDPVEFTQARSDTDVSILDEEQAKQVGHSRLALGTVEITEQVLGYRRRSLVTGERLGDVDLRLPASELTTRAFWYTFDDAILNAAGTGGSRAPGTLHAAEHAAIGMLPLFTICDRWDVGGVSTARQGDTGMATIVIYDGYPGGAGIAELGFDAGRRHLVAAVEAIAACPCDNGCPSCVQSPKCGNLNEPLDKAGAVALLTTVLSG